MDPWNDAESSLALAEGHLAQKKYKEAKFAAWEAGRLAIEAYEAFRGAAVAGSLAERAKALELPFEVFAVCDKLDQENPKGPKKMLPVRPDGEIEYERVQADERVHQARSLVRFLKWAHEEPPGESV